MYYVLDEKGNRKEGLTKEETLAILQQAIDNGSLAGIEKDSAFVSKLKCCVGGETFQMAFVTQAKYNELFNNNQLTDNTFYYITDDPTEENIESNIEALAKEIDETNEIIGDIVEGRTVADKLIIGKKLIWSGSLERGNHINIKLDNSKSYLFVTKSQGEFLYDHNEFGEIPTATFTLKNHEVGGGMSSGQGVAFQMRNLELTYGTYYENGVVYENPTSLYFNSMYNTSFIIKNDGTLMPYAPTSTTFSEIIKIYEITM